jgi:hypothetical protein
MHFVGRSFIMSWVCLPNNSIFESFGLLTLSMLVIFTALFLNTITKFYPEADPLKQNRKSKLIKSANTGLTS